MKRFIIAALCILCSLLLNVVSSTHVILQVVRIITLAYGFVIIGYEIMRKHVKKSNAIAYYIGIIMMIMFTVLTLDTYLFHTLLFIPGIVRYPLYSLYGVAYLFFILPGILLAFRACKQSDN